ncbi:hypothetical protein N6N71_22245 [Escherichia albertii]|uniref:hypothetical protein n=1 Tax=Escherichia albertii TaxID=208962 RepID=UPI0021D47CC1|nr:hypothetical protein [Escherichia albertii]MCU7311254.1 hypothetical protein [Escherichia albertii]
MSIKNDGHYFCRAGGNRPDGLNEPVTDEGPVSRESVEYYRDHEQAAQALENGTWTQRTCA